MYSNNAHLFLLMQCFVFGQTVSEDQLLAEPQEVPSTNISNAKDQIHRKNLQRLTESTSPKDVKFFAFSKQTNAAKGLQIKIGQIKTLQRAGFGKSNKLVLFAEGFLGHYTDETPINITQAYKDTREDVNVVLVDYDKLSNTDLPFPINFASYFQVLKNIRTVGKVVAIFIEFVLKAGYLEGLEKVHFIGHSIGAHVGGSAGYQTEKLLGKKIGRISGLDPAGPFMNLLKPSDRLTANKALFVDVVHTDIELFGTPAALGTIDFYANGGIDGAQNQCLTNVDLDTNPICPHEIAMNYFLESIRGAKYTGCPCARNKKSISNLVPCPRPKLHCHSPAIFGEFANNKYKGKYYVEIE